MSSLQTRSAGGVVAALRVDGAAAFAQSGLPTQRHEAWRYTSLNRLRTLGLEPESHSPVATAQPPSPLLDGPAHRLVFVDGRLVAEWSSIGSLPAGVFLGSLAQAVSDETPGLTSYLGALAKPASGPMIALNNAWIADGLVLLAPANAVIDHPIEVTYINGGTAYPRHVIGLGTNASATIVERHLGSDQGGFANAVTEIELGAGASLRHYILHAEPDSALSTTSLFTRVGRDSRYRSFIMTAGGGLVRHQADVALAAPGGECQLDGAYLVDGERHADINVQIDHQAPNCTSRQTQKGVVDGRGRAVFVGKILVQPDAQKERWQPTQPDHAAIARGGNRR